jgi:hypothetical protein
VAAYQEKLCNAEARSFLNSEMLYQRIKVEIRLSLSVLTRAYLVDSVKENIDQ